MMNAGRHGGHPQHQPERGNVDKRIQGVCKETSLHKYRRRAACGDPTGPARRGAIFTHPALASVAGLSGDTVAMATITYQGLEVLYTRQQIADRVAEMGAEITRDLNGEKVVMVAY